MWQYRYSVGSYRYNCKGRKYFKWSRGWYVFAHSSLHSILFSCDSLEFTNATGALVLSDQGLCCIDEFDKMGQSHNALLEVMEQQRVSVAKAGIVCNLSARCSIVAAANPVGGHYDRGKTVAENLKMSAPLLSRFDLIFILLDRPDARHDERLASYIMSMHTKSSSSVSQKDRQRDDIENKNDASDEEEEEITSKSIERRLKRASSSKHIGADPLPPRLLRRYIAYARRYVRLFVLLHRLDEMNDPKTL